MSAQTIYEQLRAAGLSAAGACGMLGNMQAESALRADNVQDGMGYADDDYIAAADAGLVDFVGDGRGFGLCQWTYGARKRKLLELARQRGVSVADEKLQTDFCVRELREEYPSLWLYLCSCKGVYEAAKRICLEYERPAVNNVEKRAQYANEWFMRLGGMENSAPSGQETEPSGWPPREAMAYGDTGADVLVLQALLLARGYNLGTADGIFGRRTHNALAGFQAAEFGAGDGLCTAETWNALLARR